jgi:acetyl-CoA C-acetyltransferase
MGDVLVFDAVRTPRGRGAEGGALARIAPHELIRQLVAALRRRLGEEAVAAAERFILSCVGQVGVQGGHLALVSRMHAGLPDTVGVMTLNNYCVGGLTALGVAAAEVRAGQAELVLAGGVEVMSQVPFLADRGAYYCDPDVAAALRYAPVGVAADLLAHREGIGRDALDAVTLESHRRAAEAWDSGRYAASVIPVAAADGSVALARDETIRANLTAERLAGLPPIFEAEARARWDAVIQAAKPEVGELSHRHSVANCPPVADGAALALVGTPEAGRTLGLTPLARLRSFAETAGDPVDQLTAGFAAMDKALASAGAGPGGMGRIEFMEAFAAVPARFLRDYDPDPARTNVNGGHLAMGHPMGATGLILTATLLHEMARAEAETGLVVAHGGSGVGAAAVFERV